MDNISDSMCHEYLRKMARLVFSDYRLIYKFADSCNSDIVNLKCGRIEDDDDVSLKLIFVEQYMHFFYYTKP